MPKFFKRGRDAHKIAKYPLRYVLSTLEGEKPLAEMNKEKPMGYYLLFARKRIANFVSNYICLAERHGFSLRRCPIREEQTCAIVLFAWGNRAG